MTLQRVKRDSIMIAWTLWNNDDNNDLQNLRNIQKVSRKFTSIFRNFPQVFSQNSLKILSSFPKLS